MHNRSLLITLLVASVCCASAKPTFDVLYKIAREIEQDLVSDSHEHRRDPYRPHRPEYGHGVGYYPPPSPHGQPSTVIFAKPYPKPYPSAYPPTYPEPYPTPYPDQYPPPRPYPLHTNHIAQPYDKGYSGQYGNGGYGVVSESNSYTYGGNYGYKQKGY